MSTDLDIAVAPDYKAESIEFLQQQGFEEADNHAKERFYRRIRPSVSGGIEREGRKPGKFI